MNKSIFLWTFLVLSTFLFSGEDESSHPTMLPDRGFQWASERLFQLPYYKEIQGKNIGFFGNKTSLATLDRLIEDDQVNVQRIFVPEHGLLGMQVAGEEVSDDLYKDIPVISAYGYGARKIDPKWLVDLDILVFEIQDIGNRHYTYISSMYLQMDSCADAGIPMLIIDRPNVAGDLVEGPILEPMMQSYIGLFGPVSHGMTMGELALFFLKEPYWMNGERYKRLGDDEPFHNVSELDLRIVPMAFYDRNKGFYQNEEALQHWIPTSPNIPSPEAAVCYKGNGLLDGHEIREIVRNYSQNQVQQFESIQLPGVKDQQELLDFIDSCKTIYPFPGVELEPKQNITTGDWDIISFRVKFIGEYHSVLSILAIIYTWESLKHPGNDNGFNNLEQFDKSMGNNWISRALIYTEKYNFSDIAQLIGMDETLFREARQPYLLYP
jgi:uncharacterized protein YbbC (DUF1343 family)